LELATWLVYKGKPSEVCGNDSQDQTFGDDGHRAGDDSKEAVISCLTISGYISTEYFATLCMVFKYPYMVSDTVFSIYT